MTFSVRNEALARRLLQIGPTHTFFGRQWRLVCRMHETYRLTGAG